MKQVKFFRRFTLTVVVIGVVIFTTPFFLSAAGTGAASFDSFSWLTTRIGGSIGPPGGEIRALAIAPMDPERLYAGTASGHLFVSMDGARLWRDCRVLLPRDALLTRLAVSPRSPDIAFASFWLPKGGGGLLRSLNAGGTWEPIAVPGTPALRAIAIAPSAPDTMYVGGPEGVWRSEDGGDTWTPAGGSVRPIREVESLAVDKRFPLRVYAGTWRQAYRSLDGGATWTLIGRGMDVDRDVFTVALSPHDPDTLFVGTCGWLYRSNDGGDRWISHQKGIPSDHRRIHTIAPDPLVISEVWAGTRGGIYRSSDGAHSFSLVRGDIAVSAIMTDPKGERVFAGTEELGVLVGGKGASFVERNSGLEATRVVAFDAFSEDLLHLIATRTENPGVQSLWMTQDAGRTWSRFAPGKRFEKVRFLRALAQPAPKILVVDGRGKWWSVTSESKVEALAEPPGRLNAVEVSRNTGLLIAATDAGLFFAQADNLSSKGSPPLEPLKRKGSPNSRRDAAAGREGDWRRLRQGALTALALEGDRFLALGPSGGLRGSVSALLTGNKGQEVHAQGIPGNVLDAALGAEEDSRAFAITRDSVFVSDDGGETWKAAPLNWPARDLRAVAANPNGPGRAVTVDSHGGILVGGGAEEPWVVLAFAPWVDMAEDILLSPTAPGIALVATLGHGIRVVSLGWTGPSLNATSRVGLTKE